MNNNKISTRKRKANVQYYSYVNYYSINCAPITRICMVEFVRALVGICKLKMEDVKKWLIGLNLVSYYDGFIENGYDDLDAIK